MEKVFLVRGIAPDAYGGAEFYQLQLAQILQKNGFEPIIVTSSKQLIKLARKEKIQTINMPYNERQNWSGWKNILLPLYFLWQIRLIRWYKKQIKQYQPVAINVQSRDDWIAATLAAKKLNIQSIFWTDHVDFRSWVFQNIHQKFKNPIGKYILKLSKIPKNIIMISDYEYDFARKKIFPKDQNNLVVIKNGVIDRKAQYRDVKYKPRSFCYVGRLVNSKGIRELIRAFKKVEREFPGAQLSIYGDGDRSDIEKYQKIAEDNKGINFYGYTNNPLLAIAQSAVFVLPSYYEGMSLSLLDATMMGKTIIATDIDGNSEIILHNKTGILVPPKNVKSLEAAMKWTLRNPDQAKQLGLNARKKYEKEFNFEKIVKEKIIKDLLND